MFYYVFVGLYVVVCFLLLVVVLLQQGKGGDIAAAFGGASSQTAFGARAGATVLTRATTILGSLFMLGAFALGIVGRGGGGSVVSGVGSPPGQTAPALPTGSAPRCRRNSARDASGWIAACGSATAEPPGKTDPAKPTPPPAGGSAS